MTQTHGYFCPKCECRWVAHLCKEELPCGCGVKTEDAVYISVHRKGKSGNEYVIEYKDFRIHKWMPVKIVKAGKDEEAKKLLNLVKNHPEKDLLELAILNAVYESSSCYYTDWFERCSKCVNFTYNLRKKCRIHNWCSISCKDFKRLKCSDFIHGRVSGEIQYVVRFKPTPDDEIVEYLNKINEFGFVKTLESCAGHEYGFWNTPYVSLLFTEQSYKQAFLEEFRKLAKEQSLVVKDSCVAKLVGDERCIKPVENAISVIWTDPSNIEYGRKILFETVIQILKDIS